MASLLVSRAPRCMSCVRHLASLEDTLQFSNCQQIRGKKMLAKVSTVNVRLLQNIPGYGKKGSIVPVTAGVMRNIWIRKKMAEYMTVAKLQELGKKGVDLERDTSFGSRQDRKRPAKEKHLSKEDPTQAPSQESPAAPIHLELLMPAKASKIISNLLPANIDFYRTPIVAPHPQPPKRISPSIPATSAISAAAAAAPTEVADHEAENLRKRSIYGSVSTSDIAANLKAILAEDKEGIRVIVSPEDISFVEQLEEDNDRVKHLGVFDIDIRLHGGSDVVRRTIRVNAQD